GAQTHRSLLIRLRRMLTTIGQLSPLTILDAKQGLDQSLFERQIEQPLKETIETQPRYGRQRERQAPSYSALQHQEGQNKDRHGEGKAQQENQQNEAGDQG